MTYQFVETEGQAAQVLVLTFHGTGADATQLHGLAHEFLPDAHVISPQGDVLEHGAARFFRRTGEGVYDMEDLARRCVAMADFIAAQADRVGADHVYALGYSNGANILAAVMLENPGLVTRAALLHPLIPWDPQPQPGLAGREVLITAGRRDPICPAPQTQALIDYLQAQEAQVDAHWHDGGHEVAQSELGAVADFLRR